MSDRSPSPFVGLDKALMRSTRNPAPPSESVPQDSATKDVVPKKPAPRRRSKDAVEPERKLDRDIDSVIARYQASDNVGYLDGMIETIRKTVKLPGREVAFVRLTPQEKQQVADIVYTYKKRGTKTSENEINRIAVNFILEDYAANGDASVLARVLAALLA